MATFQQAIGAQGLSFASGGFLTYSYTDAITARAGGGQALATQLSTQVSNVTVCATAADSVKLPTPAITNINPAGPANNLGNMVVVINSSANTLAVFPDLGATINGGSANASVSVAGGDTAVFFQTAALTWFTTDTAAKLFSNLTLTGLLYESATDNLTALTGGQGGALALTTEVNRFGTVAAGFGAKLPAATLGLTILIINHGANALQVFGAGTDTINDVATATGVSQMVGSMVLYTCTTSGPAGKWYSEGLATGYVGSFQTLAFIDAMTAVAGGQGSAVALAGMINRVTTCPSSGGVLLPASAGGLMITVINSGANTLSVFPAGSDTINSLAASAAFLVPAGGVALFNCTVAGSWFTPYVPAVPLLLRTSISSGNGTLTGAQVAGAQTVTLLTSGATAQTTPTAAAMLAAIPSGQVGSAWRLRIVNTNAGTLTITADASVTASGTLTLATNTWREWDMAITGATTATMNNVGTGTTS